MTTHSPHAKLKTAMSRRLNIFTPNEQRITRGIPDATLPQYPYTLFVEVQSGCVKFYYSAAGQGPVPNSGPMDIPVFENCRIKLTLDGRRLWEFRYDGSSDAMTLGAGAPLQYYPKLNQISPSELEFEAHVAPDSSTPSDVVHPFNLYVSLLQGTGTTAWKIPIKIDPDILNPGDHRLTGPTTAQSGKVFSRSKGK